MRHAVLAPRLVRDGLGEKVVADARGAKREEVDVGVLAVLAEVPRREGRDGRTERVACDDDLVRGVGAARGGDGGENGGGDFVPGREEAGVGEAAEGEGARDLGEDEAGGGVSLRYGCGGAERGTYSTIQLRTETEPRKETTMARLVWSTAVKPRMSVIEALKLAMVEVLWASTSGQKSFAQASFWPGALASLQEAAAEYWANRRKSLISPAVTASGCVSCGCDCWGRAETYPLEPEPVTRRQWLPRPRETQRETTSW